MELITFAFLWVAFAVPPTAGAVFIYNRYLAKMHESVLKKIIALSSLPSGVMVGFILALLLHHEVQETPIHILFFMIPALLLCAPRTLQEHRNRTLAKSIGHYERAPSPTNVVPTQRFGFVKSAILKTLQPINGVGNLRVFQATVPVRDLPREFEGYRIVHLTDIHVHPSLKPSWYEHVLTEVNKINADMILFGGDFISKPSYVHCAERVSKRLAARDGVFFVRGNHDFWKGTHRITRLARKHGMRLLSNEGVVLKRGDGELAVIGFETPYIPITVSEKAEIRKLPNARIGLIHDPVAYPDAAQSGCSVALAGHTHGGQVRLPLVGTTISGTVAPLQYTSGVSRMGKMLTITNHGPGAFFPLRFLCSPELVVMTLTRSATG